MMGGSIDENQVTCQVSEHEILASVNLACILESAARAHGERSALLLDQRAVSYAGLWRESAAAAAFLEVRGVAPGDRVGLVLPNGEPFVAAYFAVLRLGAVAVPLNVLLSPTEIDERLRRAGARVVVTSRDWSEQPSAASAGIVDRDDADPAVLLFTSGTSGTPKGAILTHGGIRAAAQNAADALALAPGDVVLGAAPFSHVLGQATGIASTLLAGAAIAVVPRFRADETLRFMARTRTTVLLGVPTMCITLCETARGADALPPLRVAHVGGAAVPAEVAREFERVFGAPVREGYGLTELSGIATTYLPGDPPRPGSVGKPLGSTELRIVSLDGEPLPPHEIGEVQLRGPSVIPGYWEDEEATRAVLAADRWLATGDLGYVDDEGYLYLVDRKKELIIRGGYNVYPREVEEALYAHPAVAEVAVVGVSHPVLGEEVAAVVVPRGGTPVTSSELQEYAKERLAAYKYPRHVVFVDTLPKGPTGKILKRELDAPALLARSERR
jgi:long-chain acyl-CoA synthetase